MTPWPPTQALLKKTVVTTRLFIRVIPSAARNEIAAPLADGTLKLRVTPPPVDGTANRAAVRLLAQELKLPIGQIVITQGTASRRKIVEIEGLSEQEVRARLRQASPLECK